MTSKKQVSPAIRISRGERDASARATHLKAASRKYLETTIERKQMSTTTNFKRIALVAVAALGLGVLSSVPSQAVTNADTLTLSATTAAQTTNETSTATSVTATLAFLVGDTTTDRISLTASLVSGPAGSTALPYMHLVETSSAAVLANAAGTALTDAGVISPNVAAVESATATGNPVSVSAKFRVYLGGSSKTVAPTVAGTYVVKLTPAIAGGAGTLASAAQNITFTVTEAAALDTKASAAYSTVYMQKGTADAKLVTQDSVVAVAKAASTTIAANIAVVQKNAANVDNGNGESITATISGAGVLGIGTSASNGTQLGRSIAVRKGDYVAVFPDGNAGVATITLTGTTSGNLLATKTVTFTGDLASFTDATAAVAILGTSARNAVTFKAKDSALNVLSSGTYYAFSSDTAVATVGTVTYSVDSGTVSVTGVAAGTATITIGNASTLAASTIKSTPVSVRVGSTAIATVGVKFDKATYAPGEKATVTVSLLDSTGKAVVPGTYEVWAAGYILASDKTLNQGTLAADTTTVTSDTTGEKTYTIYMPLSAGVVTLSATTADNATTGRTLKLATAAQAKAITATATVVDSGSSALAAVTALATTVASLKTLIVTLTNLVLKIQKKVKA